MNRLLFSSATILASALVAFAGGIEFQPGVKLMCGDKPIDDARLGHFAPTVADVNGDGKKDLIIGMFAGTPGNVQLYLNAGTDAEPKFNEFTTLAAGGAPIKLTGA